MNALLSVFSFRGRARRTSYGLFFLVTLGLYFGVSLPLTLLLIKVDPEHVFEKTPAPDPSTAQVVAAIRAVPVEIVYALAGFAALVVLVAYIAWIAIGVRRLHDMNRSGWLMLLFALVAQVPFLGYLLVSLLLVLWPGTKGPNRYGADPRISVKIADVFGSGPYPA